MQRRANLIVVQGGEIPMSIDFAEAKLLSRRLESLVGLARLLFVSDVNDLY